MPTTHDSVLVSTARANGLAVSLQDRRREDSPGTAVELEGYRIVQEALTNAAKHASGSDVLVAIKGRRRRAHHYRAQYARRAKYVDGAWHGR